MENESLTVKIWCAECNKFTETFLRRNGTRQKGVNNINIIFKWICQECLDNDIGEISSQDWEALKRGHLTHFRFN